MQWYCVFALGMLTSLFGIIGGDKGDDAEPKTPVQADRVDINLDANKSPAEHRT